MILCVFYDLLKNIQVIHYMLDLGNERKNNKTLKVCSNAMFKGDGKSDQIFICKKNKKKLTSMSVYCNTFLPCL